VELAIFHAINNLAGHHDSIDDVMERISQIGPFALVGMLVALWFWPGARPERDNRQWSVIAATIAACVALGVNQVIIRVWARPRPFLGHHVHLLMAPKTDPSFPSDHATFAFAVAVAIFLASRRAGIVALLLAALVAVSRVYVGEHYPTDVVVGACIGSIAAYSAQLLRPFVLPLIDPVMARAKGWRLA
jgi:undecaprenyl-diphosphatase